MADKRIIDFPLLDEVSEDDYVLVSSNNNTYKAKAGAFGELSGSTGGYFKKIFAGTLTEEKGSFKFTTFADGTPLKFTELFIRGAATTNLAAGNVQNLNVYYGWGGDGIYNAYKGIGMIPNFCQPSGTDISSSEYSMKAELLGTKIYNQYGYGTASGVSKTEVNPSETEIFTQLAFWSGGAGVCQPGSWFEIYARCENGDQEESGTPGADGITPHIGSNGNWFIGETDTGVSAQGEQGEKGDKGDTPVKGTDYFTEDDKTELVNSVLNSLPTWQGGEY